MLLENSVIRETATNRRFRVSEASEEQVVLFTLPVDPKSKSRALDFVSYPRARIEKWLATGAMEVLNDHPYHPPQRYHGKFIVDEADVELDGIDEDEKNLAIQKRRLRAVMEVVSGGVLPLAGPLQPKIITDAAEKNGDSDKSVRSWVALYFIRGMTPRALWPDFEECGARGVRREPGDQKRGRPPVYEGAGGSNVTPEVRKKMRDCALEILPTMKSVEHGYHIFTEKHFLDGYQEGASGHVETVFIPPHLRPSLASWVHYFYTDREFEEDGKRRYGEAEWSRLHRATSGNEGARAYMPGGTYQFDFARANIILVHPVTRLPIGRPALGLARDVASPMVPGFRAAMSNPSAQEALYLFENVVLRKSIMCARYGVMIKDEDWPVEGLPKAIIVDNGEWRGKRASIIPQVFGVGIEHTRAYHAADKGTIEREIGLVKNGTIDYLPGRASRHRERGEKSCELDAKLSLYAFNQILIQTYLKKLNKPIEGKYVHPGAIRAGCSTLASYWAWAMDSGHGGLREAWEPDRHRLASLPQMSAFMNGDGVRFRDLRYASESIRGILSRARDNSRWIRVSYDWLIDHIYAYIDGNVYPLGLAEKDMVMYGGQNLDWEDVKALRHLGKQGRVDTRRKVEKDAVDLQTLIDDIVERETSLTDHVTRPTGYSIAPAAMKVAKSAAAKEEKKENSHLLDVGVPSSPKIVPFHKESEAPTTAAAPTTTTSAPSAQSDPRSTELNMLRESYKKKMK